MPVFKQGNMWDIYIEVDNFVITTNSFLKNNGAVVMGRGIAQQARDSFEGIDFYFGERIKESCGHLGTYGFIFTTPIALFQVKKHFKDQASLELISLSTEMLASAAKKHPKETFALNYPGVGNGKLDKKDVQPIIETLPDNVQIWTFK